MLMRALLLLLLGCGAFAQPQNWPAVLEADVRSGSWAAAVRVGEATVQEIEAGRLFPRFEDVEEEAKVRRFFAEALDHAGKSEQAREQRCMARQILAPESNAPCAAKAAMETERRLGLLKSDLLAGEIKIRAPFPFARSGAVSIVAFWAKWCAPCMKELEELRRYRNPSAELVTVDVERLSTEAKSKYVPMSSLDGPEVPRFYVIDREGNIRFHLAGFDSDRWFTKKLDWMVEAALR